MYHARTGVVVPVSCSWNHVPECSWSWPYLQWAVSLDSFVFFITASYPWRMLLVPEVFLRATGKNCFCAWTGTCNLSKMCIIASIRNNNSWDCHKPLGPRYIYPWLLWQCQVPCRRSPKDLVEVLGPLLRTLYEWNTGTTTHESGTKEEAYGFNN